MKNMTLIIRRILAVGLVLMLMSTLVACSNTVAGDTGAGYADAEVSSRAEGGVFQPNETSGASFDYDQVYLEEAVPSATVAAPQAPMMVQGGAPEMELPATSQQPNNTTNVQEGRKLTFWASISMDTKSFDADYQSILTLITQSSGYVASETMRDLTLSTNYDQGRFASLSVKVPAAGYNSFLDKLSEIGIVTNRNMWSDDLTAVYFDTETRIEMLELRRDRLMGYLLEAERAEDIVDFERELSSVLYDLDAYQGDRRQLDQLVDFSTVDITLTELMTPETIGADGEPLGERASTAFALSAKGVERFLQGVLVFLAGAIPVLILLAGIALVAWLLIKLVRVLRARYKESKLGKAQQERKDDATIKKMQKVLRKQELQQRAYTQMYPQASSQPEPSQGEKLPAPSGTPLKLDDSNTETSKDQ